MSERKPAKINFCTPNAAKEIILDCDATDDPLHGKQEGRFFHGYYGCYCYLPLFVLARDSATQIKAKAVNNNSLSRKKEKVRLKIGNFYVYPPPS